MQIQTLVNVKYQVVIPRAARQKIKIKPGQKMNVEVRGEKVILSKAKTKKQMDWPHDYVEKLKNPWEGVNVENYLEEERRSWD